MTDYSEITSALFRAPRNAGRHEQSNDVVVGRAGDRKSGTEVQFSLRLAGTVVKDARFLAFGCPHTIAAASCVASQLVGADVSVLDGFDPHWVAAELEVPPEKLGRLLVIEDAIAVCRDEIARYLARET